VYGPGFDLEGLHRRPHEVHREVDWNAVIAGIAGSATGVTPAGVPVL
jgi:hypothetical protein